MFWRNSRKNFVNCGPCFLLPAAALTTATASQFDLTLSAMPGTFWSEHAFRSLTLSTDVPDVECKGKGQSCNDCNILCSSDVFILLVHWFKNHNSSGYCNTCTFFCDSTGSAVTFFQKGKNILCIIFYYYNHRLLSVLWCGLQPLPGAPNQWRVHLGSLWDTSSRPTQPHADLGGCWRLHRSEYVLLQ